MTGTEAADSNRQAIRARHAACNATLESHSAAFLLCAVGLQLEQRRPGSGALTIRSHLWEHGITR